MTKELIGVIFPQIDRYFPFHGSKILSIFANFLLKLIGVRSFLCFGIYIPSVSTSPSDHFIGKLHGNVKVSIFLVIQYVI